VSYSPELGRWMEQDPSGYVDGLNPYQYERSAPTRWLDPDGRQAQPAPPATVGEMESEFNKERNMLAKLKLAVAAANQVFAKCGIKIELIEVNDMRRMPADQQAKVLDGLRGKKPEEQLGFLAKIAQEAATTAGAHIGVGLLDLKVFGKDDRGMNPVDAAKGRLNADKNILTLDDGAFLGGILLSSTGMTSLSLAQEIRDRLAHEENNSPGGKLRNGDTADLIKNSPNARLDSLCDDECTRLRQGLRRLGLINEDPVEGKEYTIKLYVLGFPFQRN
jgi:uncharacterized protein RhaS with RHS repeats